MSDTSTSQTEAGKCNGFWSDQTWRALTDETAPVHPFDVSHLDEANYLLSIGEEVYVSDSGGKSTVRKLTQGECFSIDAGQYAFLLTEEEVVIPFDKIGFISIRASVKFWGLVNISGFHVDPGYKGKLIFAVFNAGPTRIHLKRGDKIFPIWISSLDRPSSRTTYKIGYYEIPAKLVNQISGEFTNAYQLAEKLKSAQEDIVQLKSFRVYLTAVLGVALILLSPFLKDATLNVFNAFWPPIKCLFAECAPADQAGPIENTETK